MTDIAAAARATRKYFVTWHGLSDAPVYQIFVAESGAAASEGFHSEEEAQAACDRLNLRAVLEAIREPSLEMQNAAPARTEQATEGSMYAGVYRAMIDALIAEVKA